MKKFLVLILGLSFIAASCDTGGIFDFGGGTRGVFKSEDAGQTFSLKDRVAPKGQISNLSVNSLALDHSNPDVVYAAAGSGIYKSENAAESWRYILSGIAVSDLAIDQFSASTIYAAGIVGKSGKIIKSLDGGVSWVDIYSEPSQNNTVLTIAISSFDSSTILAGLNSGELIRSTDAGKTWQATEDFANRVVEIKFGPSNTAYTLTVKNGLYKSTDSGLNWAQVSGVLTADSLNSVNKSLSSVSAFHDLSLDRRQTGIIYLGTEEGIYRTVDDGANWSHLALPLRNAALRVSSITVDPANSNNLFATVVSTIYKSTNGGVSWETKVLPTSAVIDTIVINPNSANIIYLGLKSQ